MKKKFQQFKARVKANSIMIWSVVLGIFLFAPAAVYAADGTSTIVTALNNVSSKLLVVGTPLASLGFVGAAITHSVSHDMQTQERAKTGMKAAGVGIGAALVGSAIIGMIASAFGQS